jgi:hypothetical protein
MSESVEKLSVNTEPKAEKLLILHTVALFVQDFSLKFPYFNALKFKVAIFMRVLP